MITYLQYWKIKILGLPFKAGHSLLLNLSTTSFTLKNWLSEVKKDFSSLPWLIMITMQESTEFNSSLDLNSRIALMVS